MNVQHTDLVVYGPHRSEVHLHVAGDAVFKRQAQVAPHVASMLLMLAGEYGELEGVDVLGALRDALKVAA